MFILDGYCISTATVDGSTVAVQVRREATRRQVQVPSVPVGAALRVDLGPMPHLATNDVRARLFALLDRAQIEYALKSRVLEVATGDQPLALRAARVMDLELEPALAGAIAEVLLAQAGIR